MLRGKQLLLSRRSRKYTILLLLALLLAFLLDNTVFGPRIHGFIGNYLLPFFMWGLIVIFMVKLPSVQPAGKLRHRRLLLLLALISVLISILINMLEGMVGQFGKSPYDHSMVGIIINMVSLGLSLVAAEMSRAWLVNRHFPKRPFMGISLIAFFFTLSNLPLNQITHLKDGLAVTKFIGMNFLPELGQNVLATYLASLGGPVPAVIYRGGLIAFERLSPVLPNASWAIQTLLGTLAPVLGFMLVQSIYREENREIRASQKEANMLGWLFTSLAAIIIIWFSLGVFSFSPRVILTGSMQPGIKIGDVVIIHKINGKDAKLGDIIMFPMGEMKVTHRVIAVKEVDQKKYFTTKGDANPDPERDPIPEKNVKGKVVMVIPKLGKLTLLMRGGG